MASFLVAIMGTNIALVWIVAFAITFRHGSPINIKVAFFSSFLILAIYIYFVFVRDHC